MRWFFIAALTAGLLISTTNSTQAKVQPAPQKGLVVPVSGDVEVHVLLGELMCDYGEIWLDSPQKTHLMNYSRKENPTVNLKGVGKGTELVFANWPKHGFCNGRYMVTSDTNHGQLIPRGPNVWLYALEDGGDKDFDDLFLEITLRPTLPTIQGEPKAEELFAAVPRYELPWAKGASQRVCQKPGGSFSHRQVFAYDFCGRFSIHAPEKGVVVWVNQQYSAGNCNNYNLRYSANVVVLQTTTETQITFVHLEKGSVVVTPGQRVEKGQLLAQSGSSGYACAPHLHMEFQEACHPQMDKTKWGTGKNPWNCPTKPLSQEGLGFWIGGSYIPVLEEERAYKNE